MVTISTGGHNQSTRDGWIHYYEAAHRDGKPHRGKLQDCPTCMDFILRKFETELKHTVGQVIAEKREG